MKEKLFKAHKKFCHESGAGFSIIELLIVVSIISLFASVVLANTIGYISKSKDSAIKSNMDSLLVDSVIYYENHGNYGGFCQDTATLNAFNAINSANKNCHSNANSWAVCARINNPSDGSIAWCVDYKSNKEEMIDSDCQNNISSCP